MRESRLTQSQIHQYSDSYDYPPNEILALRKKYVDQRHHSKSRGIEHSLTFDEYLHLAKASDIKTAEQIGKSATSFQLGRVGDRGGYSKDNCRFITVLQNRKESVVNGGQRLGNDARRGSNNSRSKLTDSDVIHIRREHANGVPQIELCRRYNVSKATMNEIVHYKIWRHL